METSPQTKNNSAILLSFFAIFLLLTFSLAKNLWQKKQDQKKEAQLEKQDSQKETSSPEIKKMFQLISPDETEKQIGKEDTLLVDLRSTILFEDSHIETSLNLPPEKLDELANRDKKQRIIIIDDAENPATAEKINGLVSQGFQVFYLDGGFEKYQALGFSAVSFGYPDSPYDVAKTRPINIQTLEERTQQGETFQFLDSRKKSSFEISHISGSFNIPLEELEARKKEVPFGRVVVVDENPLRAFQAAVRLFDMHFIDVLYLSEDLSLLKK